MKLDHLLNEMSKAEALELQQRCIDLLPDELDITVGVPTDGRTGGKPCVIISRGRHRPFYVTDIDVGPDLIEPMIEIASLGSFTNDHKSRITKSYLIRYFGLDDGIEVASGRLGKDGVEITSSKLEEGKKELLHLQQAMIDDLDDDRFEVSIIKGEDEDYIWIFHPSTYGKPKKVKPCIGDGASSDSLPKDQWSIMVLVEVGWAKFRYEPIINLLKKGVK